jgi:hypothetical protein
MIQPRTTIAAAVAVAAALAGTRARADLPPPEGMTRVDYLFRVDGVPEGTALVAFPAHNMGEEGGLVVPLTAGTDVRSFQGYTPGIYALAPADAAKIPREDRGEQAQAEAYLTAKARKCLKQVPRVFQVATTTGLSRMTDVIHVNATAGGCSATLVTTIYEGANGARGEGGVDANGERTPPAPFGKDFANIKESGLDVSGAPPPAPTPPVVTPPIATPPVATPPVTPTPAPAKPEAPKAAGCSLDPSGAGLPGAWLLVAFVGLLRRRRRAQVSRRCGGTPPPRRCSARRRPCRSGAWPCACRRPRRSGSPRRGRPRRAP